MKTKRILIAVSDRYDRWKMAKFMDAEGCNYIALNEMDLCELEMLKNIPFDLAIIDFSATKLKGNSLLKHLQEDRDPVQTLVLCQNEMAINELEKCCYEKVEAIPHNFNLEQLLGTMDFVKYSNKNNPLTEP